MGVVVTIATLYDVIAIQLASNDDETKSYNLSQNNAINMTKMYTNGSYAVTEVENGPLPVKEDLGISDQNGIIATANLPISKPKQEQSK